MSVQPYGAQRAWPTETLAQERKYFWDGYPLLLMFAIAVDLFTPFLMWKHILPNEVRWLSDLAIAMLLSATFIRMLAHNHIPRATMFVVAVSLLGITVANFESQRWDATAWGWWSMFRYPLLGLYAYLLPKWPDNRFERLLWVCFWLLVLEVGLQLGQFATGEVPGDDLAGSFGRHGVNGLMSFLALVLSLAWGRWLVNGNWKLALFVTILGLCSSTLGEIKFYYLAMLIVAGLALAIHASRTGRMQDFFIYGGALCMLIFVFAIAYNALVADVRGTKRLEDFLEWENTQGKLSALYFDVNDGIYRFGRGFSLSYGWESIKDDPVTLLFGFGIGARSESKTLGIMGVGFLRSEYGLASGPSSLRFIQEVGMGGILAFLGFILWMATKLLRYSSQNHKSSLTAIGYGLAIFTILWPLWIINHTAWESSVAQELYWATMGFFFSKINES